MSSFDDCAAYSFCVDHGKVVELDVVNEGVRGFEL